MKSFVQTYGKTFLTIHKNQLTEGWQRYLEKISILFLVLWKVRRLDKLSPLRYISRRLKANVIGWLIEFLKLLLKFRKSCENSFNIYSFIHKMTTVCHKFSYVSSWPPFPFLHFYSPHCVVISVLKCKINDSSSLNTVYSFVWFLYVSQTREMEY